MVRAVFDRENNFNLHGSGTKNQSWTFVER